MYIAESSRHLHAMDLSASAFFCNIKIKFPGVVFFAVSDKLILFFLQIFHYLLLMEVHNMASAGIPVDQVSM